MLYPLLNPQILAKEEAIMVEEIEVQKTKVVVFILVEKGEVWKPTNIVMIQGIVSIYIGRNTLKNLPILKRKLNNKRRPTQAI